MKLIFFDSPHNLQSISSHDSVGSSLKIFDQPLIIWNILAIDQIQKVDTILIPENYTETFSLVKEKFPLIHIQYHSIDSNKFLKSLPKAKRIDLSVHDQIVLTFNSVLYRSKETQDVIISEIQYPWEYLKSIQDILSNHVLESQISPNAKISKTSVIEGPCIVEENVAIDDFCKIKGPVFIGKNSFVGMGSLVRNCMLGSKTSIGFNCEISKCYFSGQAEIAHHNVILDSIIGEHVWFGGYSGTANVLLTKKNVKYQVGDSLMDTGINHFGAVVGDNCSVGAAVIILPGRQVLPNSSIQAGTIFGVK